LLSGAAPAARVPAAAPVASAVAVPRSAGPPAGRYRVTPRPASAHTDLRSMHEWLVSISDPTGSALRGCRVAFDARMPEHGHGLPTEPRVTREGRPGEYVVEGVRFSMPGRWELMVKVADCGGPPERVTFDFRI
jgi:YtkA-like